MTFPANDY